MSVPMVSPNAIQAFAMDLTRRLGDLAGRSCPSCGDPLTRHYAADAVSAENPMGFIGCPEAAKQRALVNAAADALLKIVASRDGVAVSLHEMPADIQQDYQEAAKSALMKLGAI